MGVALLIAILWACLFGILAYMIVGIFYPNERVARAVGLIVAILVFISRI